MEVGSVGVMEMPFLTLGFVLVVCLTVWNASSRWSDGAILVKSWETTKLKVRLAAASRSREINIKFDRSTEKIRLPVNVSGNVTIRLSNEVADGPWVTSESQR